MTVEEIIEKLMDCDPKLFVVADTDDGMHGIINVSQDKSRGRVVIEL